MREQIRFHSQGEEIDALLFTPDDQTRPHPLVVMAGGWCYVKELAQPLYAEAFARNGIASLVFDYRTMGGSSGEPRQHIDPWAQIEDYRNAISFAETLDVVDRERIGAWGISYSGGHVLILAALDERVRCATCVVPVIDGWENMRLAHGTIGFRRLRETLLAARRHQFMTGEETYIPHASAHPDQEVVTWPFPASAPMFERLKASQAPQYENRATAASTDMLLAYTVMPYVSRITSTPVLFCLAEGDDHTHWELAFDAFHAVPTTDKELFVLPGSTHHTIYEDNDHLHAVAEVATAWFSRHLAKR